MKGKSLAVAAVAIASWAAPGAQAQTTAADKTQETERLLALARQDVRGKKADIIAKTMKLDAAQAAAFWPVYKAYDAERQVLGDQQQALILDFANQFASLDDDKAKALLERAFTIRDKRLALEKKYKDELLKVVPARTVARFFQVDSRINNLIDLDVSSGIPLVY